MATAVRAGSSAGRGRKGAGRARLDSARIIAAGLELAAKPGVTSISVRDLGALLGTDPTAIYRYFRNKEELMRALLDEVISGVVAEVAAAPEDWPERLRQLARRTLVWFDRYPAVGAEATVLTTHGPGELAAIALTLDAFRQAGLDGDELVRHYALYASHSLSGAAGIARARAGRPAPAEPVGTWLDAPLLADPRQYPLIAAYSAALVELRDDEVHLSGIDLIIESARATAASGGPLVSPA